MLYSVPVALSKNALICCYWQYKMGQPHMKKNMAISSKATYNPSKNLPWGDISTKRKPHMYKVFHKEQHYLFHRQMISFRFRRWATEIGRQEKGGGACLPFPVPVRSPQQHENSCTSSLLLLLALTASKVWHIPPRSSNTSLRTAPHPQLSEHQLWGTWGPAPWCPQEVAAVDYLLWRTGHSLWEPLLQVPRFYSRYLFHFVP